MVMYHVTLAELSFFLILFCLRSCNLTELPSTQPLTHLFGRCGHMCAHMSNHTHAAKKEAERFSLPVHSPGAPQMVQTRPEM